jgi:uncharacterized membrane protein YfbV (UPF0208 family)
MFNANLFTIRNILVIAAFALVWQVVMSRVTGYLHKTDTAPATADA